MADTPLYHCLDDGYSTVHLEWQTGVLVPLFKVTDQIVCSIVLSYCSTSLGKRNARALERRVQQLTFRRNNAVFTLVMEHWTSSILSGV